MRSNTPCRVAESTGYIVIPHEHTVLSGLQHLSILSPEDGIMLKKVRKAQHQVQAEASRNDRGQRERCYTIREHTTLYGDQDIYVVSNYPKSRTPASLPTS
jgi:hypothetical protein